MADMDIAKGAERFEVRVTADTHFGWLRTRLSVERTMLAWVRTAGSPIGFGFAIVQFFGRMDQVQRSLFPSAPTFLGLSSISCSIRDGNNSGLPPICEAGLSLASPD